MTEIAEVRRLVEEERLSYSRIGRLFGRGRSAVAGLCRRQGIHSRNRQRDGGAPFGNTNRRGNR